MNFQEFASKVRAQAKDAASKIPTFDDMAATDDYIHSEEFNVRGQPKPKPKSKPLSTPDQDHETISRSPGTSAGNSTTGSFLQDGSTDRDEPSSAGSWSLLDRRIRVTSKPQEMKSDSESEPVATKMPPPPLSVMNSGAAVKPPAAATQSLLVPVPRVKAPDKQPQTQSLRMQSGMPLLSVVANALQNDNPTYLKQTSGLSGYESDNENSQIGGHGPGSDKGRGVYSSDDSESDDDDSVDEEDPIMSMIRKEKPTPTPSKNKGRDTPNKNIKSGKTSKSGKKSSRLLDDLDQRLLFADNQSEGQQNTTNHQQQQQQHQQQPEQVETNTPLIGARFGTWAKTVMTTNVNRVLRRPESTPLPTLASVRSPPLARQKPATTPKSIPDEENFNVAASSSVLADDELAQLAQLKKPSTLEKLSALIGSVKENRHFLFILFTLVLAMASYFYSRRTLEDDVT